MIAVADGGSTKADWRFVRPEGGIEAHSTTGFNPVLVSSDDIVGILERELPAGYMTKVVTGVFYYGTGCSDPVYQDIVRSAMNRIFPGAEVMVDHDLTAAARATCGHEEGIACILGTGSNSGFYDGKNLLDQVTNLGYLLGDKGSGNHIGKLLLTAYFYREMPKELAADFGRLIPGGRSELLQHLYREPAPNAYLATFARFCQDHRDHFFVQSLVATAFEAFVDRHLRKYQRHMSVPSHFVGSVAFYFQEIMRSVLSARGMQTGLFIQKPIDRLVLFHAGDSEKAQP